MKRFNVAVDTNVIENPNCECCRNSELRHTDKDGLCKKIKSVVDKLPVRCVGDWANDKIKSVSRIAKRKGKPSKDTNGEESKKK